ncbi:hypothetical protein V6Z11_D01G173300 [Gossypium hirsutum]|uniref:Uncharacterized protein isoform X2 n=1 Tax=Gossypium hirsutum TaxID=3635 RepID=A0ABM2ZIH6_GOSHI|nr:uncharacterized protein LOC107922597 isoform X2 [Gossypium hirsutum]
MFHLKLRRTCNIHQLHIHVCLENYYMESFYPAPAEYFRMRESFTLYKECYSLYDYSLLERSPCFPQVGALVLIIPKLSFLILLAVAKNLCIGSCRKGSK